MGNTTLYGFDFGHLRVERMVEHNGYVVVRVLNRVSGKYVEIQTTPAGRKQYVNAGTIDADKLEAVLTSGVE